LYDGIAVSWKYIAKLLFFAAMVTVMLSWSWSHHTPAVSHALDVDGEGLHPDHAWLDAGRTKRHVTHSFVHLLSDIRHGEITANTIESATHRLHLLSGHLDQIERSAPQASYVRISSRFGMRFHPILRRWRMHNGVDYAAPRGTRILAVDEGVVTFVGWAGAAGRLVKVEHDGYESLYAHMSRFAQGLEPGAKVVQGQYLGGVGASGRSTGHHLHFAIKIDGKFVDPLTVDMGRIEPIKEAQFLVDFEKGMARTVTDLQLRTLDAFEALAAESEDAPEIDELWFDDTFL